MINLADKYTRVLKTPEWLLLTLLEQFVNGALLQIQRVERTRRTLNARRSRDYKHPTAAMIRLFLDAHFYFICIGQANKCLRQLCEVLGNKALSEAHRTFEKEFPQEIRNDLEHLDERAVGKLRGKDVDAELLRAWNCDFITFRNDKFSFGGKFYPVNKDAANRLRQAYRDVIAVIRAEYALKDPRFGEDERRELEQRKITRQVEKTLGISRRTRPKH